MMRVQRFVFFRSATALMAVDLIHGSSNIFYPPFSPFVHSQNALYSVKVEEEGWSSNIAAFKYESHSFYSWSTENILKVILSV